MGKFDISKFATALENVSNSDTARREQIEYIDIGLIDDDPKNFYRLTDLDELAGNIELLGLQQPLRVRTNPDDPNRVIIVSGHRRRAAIRKLVDDGRADFAQIPCIRETAQESAAHQELRLIFANSSTRTLSPSELSKQVSRVEELLYILKEEGVDFPGRMRDRVAAACHVSAPKLARLKVIQAKLIPDYMAMFDQGQLTEQAAYALARLPEEFQQRMASVLTSPPSGHVAEKVLTKYNDGWRWAPDMSCPDGKSCKRGDTFLRRDCEAPCWSAWCGGASCCLSCGQAKTEYSPCERMCSKAKAQRKEDKAQKEEKLLASRRKEGRKMQRETQKNAKRLLRAIDAAGVSDDVQLPWRSIWSVKRSVGCIRKWAAGEFDDPAKWRAVELDPEDCSCAGEVARLLGCSADFVLGLTDDLRPQAALDPPEDSDCTDPSAAAMPCATASAPACVDGQLIFCGWMPGGTTPVHPCDVVVDLSLGDKSSDPPIRMLAYFDGNKFLMSKGRRELSQEFEIVRWIMLPPVEYSECEIGGTDETIDN